MATKQYDEPSKAAMAQLHQALKTRYSGEILRDLTGSCMMGEEDGTSEGSYYQSDKLFQNPKATFPFLDSANTGAGIVCREAIDKLRADHKANPQAQPLTFLPDNTSTNQDLLGEAVTLPLEVRAPGKVTPAIAQNYVDHAYQEMLNPAAATLPASGNDIKIPFTEPLRYLASYSTGLGTALLCGADPEKSTDSECIQDVANIKRLNAILPFKCRNEVRDAVFSDVEATNPLYVTAMGLIDGVRNIPLGTNLPKTPDNNQSCTKR